MRQVTSIGSIELERKRSKRIYHISVTIKFLLLNTRVIAITLSREKTTISVRLNNIHRFVCSRSQLTLDRFRQANIYLHFVFMLALSSFSTLFFPYSSLYTLPYFFANADLFRQRLAIALVACTHANLDSRIRKACLRLHVDHLHFLLMNGV